MVINQAHEDNAFVRHMMAGIELKGRIEPMVAAFQGFAHPHYDQAAWLEILDDYLDLEARVTRIEFFNFLYGYIARAALNAMEIDTARRYAAAGYLMTQAFGDMEGVACCSRVLRDLAGVEGQAAVALEAAIVNQQITPDAEQESLIQMLMDELPNDLGHLLSLEDYLLQSDRPESYQFFEDERAWKKENKIRLMMFVTGDSRDAVLERRMQ